MVEKNSFKANLSQKIINLAKKSIFLIKHNTSFTRRYKFENQSGGDRLGGDVFFS